MTRRERRDQARSKRKQMESEAAAGAVRRRRLSLLGATTAAVLMAVVVIALATGGSGSKSPPRVGSSAARTIETEVDALLTGIPQRANVLGSRSAPVTIEYFGDLECSACQAFTLDSLPTLISRWVRTGKVRVEYRSLETATRDPEVFKLQQVAALAAGAQNRMWNFIETFYHEQGAEGSGYVNDAFLQGIARQIPGLNLSTWTDDRSNAAYSREVVEGSSVANSNGLTATPSFLLGRSSGALKKFEDASITEPGEFSAAIEDTLAR
ncbi:MAG: thioredoxin domain-containing protein [Solirubrobacteraceae bacterium]